MADMRLPIHTMPFIGRGDEIAAIGQRLADPACHLLTLVGPGGIGKTRLAIEVAKQITMADGLYFVDLQPVNSGELLVTTIANSIGVIFSGSEDPRSQLLSYLGEHETLLLLDNFEQLLDSVDVLSDIVKFASGIKLLVTSREALNIQEEWVWQVGGLDVPDQQAEIPIETFSAVQLFVERARRVRQDFTLAGQESHIMHVCQLVGGMPLALELAASWTKALSCAEIADEIQRSLNFLTTNMRNVPERHRSMQAVFDHSWLLLTDDERAVFPKLSVFRGGFRREAAEQVAGASLTILAGLVDKSFLRVSTVGRYSVHELMRQYGEERLDYEAKSESQHGHCIYYTGFLHQCQLQLRGPEQATALDEIGDELDNVRASWEFALEHDMRGEIHQSMHSLFLFCHIRAQAVEGERLFDMAVRHFEHEDSATLAYLLLARTWLAANNGRIVGVEQFPRAMRLVSTFWTEDIIAMQFWAYIDLRSELLSNKIFDFEQYEAVCRDYLEVFMQHDQHWGVAWMHFSLGNILLERGKVDEAERHFRDSEAKFLQIGDRWASCWSSIGLAWVFEKTEQYREAHQVLQGNHDIAVEVGDWGGIIYVPLERSRIARKQKDYQASRFYIVQSIKTLLEVGSQFAQLNDAVHSLIALLVSEDRHERAAELSSFLHQRANEAGSVHTLITRAQGIHNFPYQRMGEGGSVQTVYAAHQVLDSLAQKLPPDIYQQAVERGKALDLRTIQEQLSDELWGYSPPSPVVPQVDALTERELEVLRLVAAGRSNRQIAHDLVVTLGTVKSHIHHIYGKLDVESRTQAVVRARELRLL
jgi:predicted ATPase/DNA-binding CsgD family transcriptional regulator